MNNSYIFQDMDSRIIKRTSLIKYLILNLQSSSYHVLRAIIGHLTRLLANKSKKRIRELVKQLALCLTRSGELQSMLLVHFILRHGSSIFASHQPLSQIDNLTALDDWHQFYSLADKDIQLENEKDTERQIPLHEIRTSNK